MRSEATQADRYGTLVPVTIEPCDRPILFELSHTADLSGWKGDSTDMRWRALLEGVRRLVAKGGHPPPHRQHHDQSPRIATGDNRAHSRSLIVWVAAAVVLAAAVATAIFLVPHGKPAAPAQLMRFTVSFQNDVRYSVGEDFVRSASISPDGKRVVFTGSDQVIRHRAPFHPHDRLGAGDTIARFAGGH